ncbi:MAG: MmgE/PrpD family protein, partial [Synergistetes bacterium]|nr:MmgE/PrpD family protein [Synergistota bacterium]
LLARDGFTGIKDLFENKFGGFYNCFTDDVYDKDRIIGDLGTRYELMGIGLKFYSTCRSKHSTIDALKKFKAEHPDIKPEEIERIVVHTTTITKKYSVDVDRIISVVSAQLSHPYVCAVVLLEGDAFIDQFTEEKIRDPKILELARKVEVIADPEIDKLPDSLRYTVYVDIYLKDGRSFRINQAFPKGHPQNPYTQEELERKFKILAGKVFDDEDHLNRIIEAVQNLEELPSIEELVSLLRKES